MAATMRCLTKFNVGLVNHTLLRNSFLNSCRFLYSDKSLGLQGYENARLNFRNQFLNVENTFRSKMEEVCNTDSSMIFTEDLKSMLHLAQKTSEDIELLIKMLTKFNNQTKEMRFGTFIFGPVVMRTLYYLDEPDLAFTAFKDPKFENFFDQLISYQILLSLLYKHAKYTEMRKVYEMIKTKELIGGYPRNSLILVMAACYKENTPETLQYGLNIWKELDDKGCQIMRRATTFLAALAIKQNSPHITIELLSSIREVRYIQIRCLKVIAYTNLRRFTEIVPILRASLEHDRPNAQKECYFKDVIEKLEEAMAQDNIPEDFELYKLITLLKKDDHILPGTLEDHLCAEITIDKSRFDRRRLGTQYTQSNFSQQPRPFVRNNSRPALRDLL
ncbi:PREDICTED: pentatricopeptide repeat-containing protein 2, mitochondrial-like isoform X1 [Trachymyrmex cornetzi]|uniref:Pentatricopeptide repeat-containing protein 2 n=1 Tax=Trachymyrmex cornetzi TaxID=471704 RepID=A0A195EAE9_9HYME|nr:PREDICTED: pentatricopeptide repeat-containing protein 2, mitochondrial-like isoform X1 [Trachymyrmex cornetzi]KYN22195.1 Pentatricopeptide repeat-containing protein 2 [Trachymyrmex cornetzi]